MTHPLFIVFEGIDGCGKSTQIEKLEQTLIRMGRRVFRTAEPTDGETGLMLRTALAGKTKSSPAEMAALFLLDRIRHNREITAALERGEDVLCDRYYYSSLAYQGSLCDFEWVKNMNLGCTEIRRPDLCVFLDIPPFAALARMNSRAGEREIYEKEESLTLFREAFFRVFDTLPDPVIRIEARGTPDAVAERILETVRPLFNATDTKEK